MNLVASQTAKQEKIVIAAVNNAVDRQRRLAEKVITSWKAGTPLDENKLSAKAVASWRRTIAERKNSQSKKVTTSFAKERAETRRKRNIERAKQKAKIKAVLSPRNARPNEVLSPTSPRMSSSPREGMDLPAVDAALGKRLLKIEKLLEVLQKNSEAATEAARNSGAEVAKLAAKSTGTNEKTAEVA